MKAILCLESSTEACSVGLVSEGDEFIIREHSGGDHLIYLNTFIRELLAEASYQIQDIDSIAVAKGPGSFTSLRAGLATAKALCFALNKPLILISSLEALAWGAQECFGKAPNYVALMDARKTGVYSGIYDVQLNEIYPPNYIDLDHIPVEYIDKLEAGSQIIGNGVFKWPEKKLVKPNNIHPLSNSARWLRKLAIQKFKTKSFENLDTAVPFYIREANITTPKPKLV
ncbi:MAG: tRNA (adenosine(37)-N6)-threonylcarbamoyltransferase complex dimerization subunit type 1 TsaB [Bacteroidota bacterium]|nr:tRNA (adenosine(37)-N6)-threonylcarbamoyltransferase complex dimerization subunit type 1 TsaB [Bacteroidota bacterium]